MSADEVMGAGASTEPIPNQRVFKIPEQLFNLEEPLCTNSATNWRFDVKARDQHGDELHPFTLQVSLTDLLDCVYLTISGSSNDLKIKYERCFCQVHIRDNNEEEIMSYKGYMDEPLFNSFWFFNICNMTHLEQKNKNVAIKNDSVEGLSLSVTIASCDEVWGKTFLAQKTMLDQSILTDMVIKTKNRDFPCHKVILAAESEYFKAMFQTNFKENETNELDWTHVFGDSTVEALLHFIYTGSKPFNIEDAQYSLLEAARLCLLPRLANMCVQCMSSGITVNNVVHILLMGERFQEQDLIIKSVNFMVRHCNEVRESSSFKELDIETKAKLLEIVWSVASNNLVPTVISA